jgi:hypothetical protein
MFQRANMENKNSPKGKILIMVGYSRHMSNGLCCIPAENLCKDRMATHKNMPLVLFCLDDEPAAPFSPLVLILLTFDLFSFAKYQFWMTTSPSCLMVRFHDIEPN